MSQFNLVSPFTPKGDQPRAIDSLVRGIQKGIREHVLLGVTGSGKTFTMANVIARLNKPALIISHNKTLAAQLYQEFRDFFPHNAVSYFVSYYDYYQPEAYVPQTDTYIEKETQINEHIDKLRLAATANLLTRPDTIVVASVSCIYNIGSPKEYGNYVLVFQKGARMERREILEQLVSLQYSRTQYGLSRGTFRVRADAIDIYPAYEDISIRVSLTGNTVDTIEITDTLTGDTKEHTDRALVYPAKHYMTDPSCHKKVFSQIRKDLEDRVSYFRANGKMLEAQRLAQRVNWDLEMLSQVGYVNGIENYSRYFDGRKSGDPPYSLLEYFKEAHGTDWLLFVDESHMTIPQIRGMYAGDKSRKQTLIDYGFRLPAALDNRPLRFEEFLRRIPYAVYVSATPDTWETRRGPTVEQLVRPTGLVDPTVSIRPVEGQITDLIARIEERTKRGERVLVTTLTKRMAEDLTAYLEQKGMKVQYLHSDVVTLKRNDILADLRRGAYNVIVGINLLREGLDIPEVSLVAVLDADKEGFLRSRVSLIQTMGRAARHKSGEVILYASTVTKSIKEAVAEVQRRRSVQLAYNKAHAITPTSISKPIRDRVITDEDEGKARFELAESRKIDKAIIDSMTPVDKKRQISYLTKRMKQASSDLDFERAAQIRDMIAQLTSSASQRTSV